MVNDKSNNSALCLLERRSDTASDLVVIWWGILSQEDNDESVPLWFFSSFLYGANFFTIYVYLQYVASFTYVGFMFYVTVTSSTETSWFLSLIDQQLTAVCVSTLGYSDGILWFYFQEILPQYPLTKSYQPIFKGKK